MMIGTTEWKTITKVRLQRDGSGKGAGSLCRKNPLWIFKCHVRQRYMYVCLDTLLPRSQTNRKDEDSVRFRIGIHNIWYIQRPGHFSVFSSSPSFNPNSNPKKRPQQGIFVRREHTATFFHITKQHSKTPSSSSLSSPPTSPNQPQLYPNPHHNSAKFWYCLLLHSATPAAKASSFSCCSTPSESTCPVWPGRETPSTRAWAG